jgi:hypothetical protein
MISYKAIGVALAAVTLPALVLTGCSANPGMSGTVHNGTNHENKAEQKFSGADIMFAQMMIPHHRQAVEMGTLAETRASSPAVATLAAQIKEEQAPEITQMKTWLKEANAPLEMGHEMVMKGLLTDADLKRLAAASGQEFDRLFLEGMIGHHLGAIEMAKVVLDSSNSAVRNLAEAIISSQGKQIAEMKTLLADN